MGEVRILRQISQAADICEDWKKLEMFTGLSAMAGIHIAVMVEPFLSYILTGRKWIESRFSKPLIAPYQRIATGDIVLLKAGPIVASFCTASVEFVELNEREHDRLRRGYSDAICADKAFWDARADKRYATLIGITDVRRLTPVKVDKHDRRGWMVVRDALPRAGPEQLLLA